MNQFKSNFFQILLKGNVYFTSDILAATDRL